MLAANSGDPSYRARCWVVIVMGGVRHGSCDLCVQLLLGHSDSGSSVPITPTGLGSCKSS